MTAMLIASAFLFATVPCRIAPAPQEPVAPPALVFPGLLAKEAREAGNPLATYAALLENADRYRASPMFAGVYDEVRANYAEFLGVPLAGVEAMALPPFRGRPAADAAIPDGYDAVDAVDAIAAAAARTRLVIFGEEHHLPQTRCLYEALLQRLWQKGYRWLAAETFTDEVAREGFAAPEYRSGYYLQDPVFASAVRLAVRLGYRLVPYDTAERGPPGDASFRDRRQAENLRERVFAKDEGAKLLVFAGRGHAAEVPPADGWQPMASVLKAATGIDPLTIFAPTMSQRSEPAQEHPLYRAATAAGKVDRPVVLARADGTFLGSGNCDAYVFWPRIVVADGRADWLRTVLGRRAVAVPESLCRGKGLRLVQAFARGDPASVVPVDQVLLVEGEKPPALMLPPGDHRLRSIDAAGSALGPVDQRVR